MDVCLRSGKPASKLFLRDGHYGVSGWPHYTLRDCAYTVLS